MPETVTNLLADMVRIPTVNDRDTGGNDPEQPLREMLRELAESWGLATELIPVPEGGSNLIVRYEVDPALPWLMFESHLDTVSVAGMTIDPFGAEVHDGRLFGRGACDTKGTGAAMLWALKTYAGSHESQPNNVLLAFTVDEEASMTGVRALASAWATRLPEKVVGVIVGEPTQLRPVVAHNGLGRYRLVTKGVAAHSSKPHKGRSAITDMVRLHQAMHEQYIASLDAAHPLTGRAQCSINQISGGSQANIIADHCEAVCDRRIVPGEAVESVMPAMQQIVDQLAEDDAGFVGRIEPLYVSPPLTQQHNGDLAEFVRRALRDCNLPDEPVGAAYGTDAGPLDEAGLPAVVLGPGDIAQAHTKDEFIELDTLERGVEVYHAIMRTAV